MLTVVQYWIGASYVIAIGLALDQMRRPQTAWAEAGRNRRFWVVLSLAMGFHGLGEYAAAAYLVGVVPRFRTADRAGPRLALQHAGAAILGRWRNAEQAIPESRTRSAAETMALIAALFVFVSSVIHSSEIQAHWGQYWLYGAFFAVCAILQAFWVALIYGDPLNRRLLIAGAVGNAALIVVWAISRTVGVPVGPQGWHPESVGVIDVLSKLDELAAVVLIAAVLKSLRAAKLRFTPLYVRLASMTAGPLVLYSVLAAAGGHHHH